MKTNKHFILRFGFSILVSIIVAYILKSLGLKESMVFFFAGSTFVEASNRYDKIFKNKNNDKKEMDHRKSHEG